MQFETLSEQTQLWSEQERPAWMAKLERVSPLARVQDLAFLIFEKPDLEQTEAFCSDFGMLRIERTEHELAMRGAGTLPAIYIARQANRARYVGAAFTVQKLSELDVLRTQAGAVDSSLSGRWGCQAVMLHDPAGHEVHVLYGCQQLDRLHIRPNVLSAGVNTPEQTQRVNKALRPALLPSQVVRCAHVVLQVENFASNAQWYMKTLGLIPSDVQVLQDGSPNLAFMRIDRGSEPVDHHAVVIAGGVENKYMHSAYEVNDLDAIGQGHQFLRSKKWRHSWGMGRHYIGSQLFDYWLDNDGFEMEHMADSDRYDSSAEPSYSMFDRKSLWMWGQDLPKHMAPPKNPLILLNVIKKVTKGRLEGKRIKQIMGAMSKAPRSWVR
jgi:hypothetical protein